MFPDLDSSGFEYIHRDNNEKFKVGQIVKYVGKKYMAGWESGYIGKEFEIRPITTENKILWIDKSLLRDVLHQSKILGIRGGSPKNN